MVVYFHSRGPKLFLTMHLQERNGHTDVLHEENDREAPPDLQHGRRRTGRHGWRSGGQHDGQQVFVLLQPEEKGKKGIQMPGGQIGGVTPFFPACAGGLSTGVY